jgi:hypothetical protein
MKQHTAEHMQMSVPVCITLQVISMWKNKQSLGIEFTASAQCCCPLICQNIFSRRQRSSLLDKNHRNASATTIQSCTVF